MIWEVRLSLASFFLRAGCWLGRGRNSGDARWIYCRKPSLNDAAFLIEKREAWSSLLGHLVVLIIYTRVHPRAERSGWRRTYRRRGFHMNRPLTLLIAATAIDEALFSEPSSL
jgi:hypothetical protein